MRSHEADSCNRLRGEVKYRRATKDFEYTYFIFNRPESLQPVGYFGVSHESPIGNIVSPANWVFQQKFRNEDVLMWIDDAVPGKGIESNTYEENLKFVSTGAPSIQTWYAQSNILPQAEEWEREKVDRENLFVFWNNCNQGEVVGPGPLLGSNASNAVSHLKTTLSSSFGEKWFNDVGILRSLEAKLDVVEKKLQQGNRNAARNAVVAFKNEVSALRDKKLGNTLCDMLVSLDELIEDLI